MKKVLITASALACCLLTVSSCKKEDDSRSPNTLTIAGESFPVTRTSVSLNSISMVHNDGANTGYIFTIYFGSSSSAPVPGTYKIVTRATASDQATLSVGRVTDQTTTVYSPTTDNATTVTLSAQDNKFRVLLPPTIVKDVSSTRTLTVSADALEQ